MDRLLVEMEGPQGPRLRPGRSRGGLQLARFPGRDLGRPHDHLLAQPVEGAAPGGRRRRDAAPAHRAPARRVQPPVSARSSGRRHDSLQRVEGAIRAGPRDAQCTLARDRQAEDDRHDEPGRPLLADRTPPLRPGRPSARRALRSRQARDHRSGDGDPRPRGGPEEHRRGAVRRVVDGRTRLGGRRLRGRQGPPRAGRPRRGRHAVLRDGHAPALAGAVARRPEPPGVRHRNRGRGRVADVGRRKHAKAREQRGGLRALAARRSVGLCRRSRTPSPSIRSTGLRRATRSSPRNRTR